MPNTFPTKPDISSPHLPDVWKCPHTGLLIPKTPAQNLTYRENLLSKARNDPHLQRDLIQACRESILYWINTFCYTYRIQETGPDGLSRPVPADRRVIPFITWPIQDEHILEIQSAITNGYCLLTDKSRDMGASWNHLTTLHHFWLFEPHSLFLELSRVRTDVDGSDNPRALFVKHDIINRYLPVWMLPKIKRTVMHIVNLDNGSRIDGESSNEAAGSGDRRKAVLLDEMAKMENAEKIKSAMFDVSPCILANSTPFGPGTAYTRWRNSGQIKVFELPWWTHPEKAKGLYPQYNEQTRSWTLRSPWYDAEATKRSPQELAQEVDADHIGSGSLYFDAAILESHKLKHARPPKTTLSVDFPPSMTTPEIAQAVHRSQHQLIRTTPRGPLRVWATLNADNRLPQDTDYILGIDISAGQGASNSTISIINKTSREKVAEWASPHHPPHEFARIVCAVALWVGGRSHNGRPLIIWETNGSPGWDFTRQLTRVYSYPNLYRNQRLTAMSADRNTRRAGFHSDPTTKPMLLGAYRRALAHGHFINHSAEALDEAGLYVYLSGDQIGPSELVSSPLGARKAHGDLVISDALANFALPEPRAARPDQPPENTFAYRLAEHRKRKKLERQKRRFDFRRSIGV